MVCTMKKSLSYKAATQSPSPWNSPEKTSGAAIPEDLEQEVVVYRRPKAVGGGVNSIKSRTKPKLSGVSRRVSCADLGSGALQGWLLTKKPRKAKWDKCTKWCVIKDTDLFVYDDQMDTVASSRIYLPAFRVSEATETKKTGAFKIYNEGTTFFFKCKTEEEKIRWINHLSLTAIQYPFPYAAAADYTVSGSSASSSGIDVNSGYSSRTSQAYSDIDEMDDSSTISEEPVVPAKIRSKKSSTLTPVKLRSRMESNQALRHLVTSIREADLDIIGTDATTRRQSELRKSMANAGFTRKNSQHNKKVFTLRSMERQKQALEYELAAIETLLNNISQSNLYDFLSHYPDYQDAMVSSSNSSTVTMRDGRRPSLTDNTSEDLDSYEDNRHTLTPDIDSLRLTSVQSSEAIRTSTSSNRSVGAATNRFGKLKHKQSITHL